MLNTFSLAVVIVNFNSYEFTINCVESLMNSDYSDFQIIIVDNNSDNDSAQRIYIDLSKRFEKERGDVSIFSLRYSSGNKYIFDGYALSKVLIIKSPVNGGFAYANNLAISYAMANHNIKLFWLLNNDTIVLRNTMSNLVAKFNSCKNTAPRVGMVGSRLMYFDNPDVVQGIAGYFNPWSLRSKHLGEGETYSKDSDEFFFGNMNYVIGASMLVNRDFVNDVGLMDEDYFLYFEEIDWACRGRKRGWDLAIATDSIVYHKEGASIGTSKDHKLRSLLSDVYVFRSRYIFIKKHYPARLIIWFFVSILVLLNRVLRRQWRAIFIMISTLGTKGKLNI